MIINIDKNVFIVIVAQILLSVALFYKKPSQNTIPCPKF